MEIIEDIIDLDPKMRFVAVIDQKGHIVESIMKSGKTSLKSQKEGEHFCKQVVERRKMRKLGVQETGYSDLFKSIGAGRSQTGRIIID